MENGVPGPERGTGFRGRTDECALLDELVSAVRRAECRSLVLWGEAGIGKTALLEYLVASASELKVVRAVGVESEMELAYASLHQLCASLLDRLERLPAPQRRALEIGFGLSGGAAPDRFLVGLTRSETPMNTLGAQSQSERTPVRQGPIECLNSMPCSSSADS
jgi:hypothetical protein